MSSNLFHTNTQTGLQYFAGCFLQRVKGRHIKIHTIIQYTGSPLSSWAAFPLLYGDVDLLQLQLGLGANNIVVLIQTTGKIQGGDSGMISAF